MTDSYTNLLNSTLLLIKPNDGERYILGTRNKQIAEYLGVQYSEKQLNSFDEVSRTSKIQFYDVIYNKIYNVSSIKECMVIGVPMIFPPGLLVSSELKDSERKIAFDVYFSNMTQLFNKINEFKKLGIDDFGDVDHLSLAVNSLNAKLKDLNIHVPEDTVDGFIAFISASKTLSNVFLKAYEVLDYLPSVQYVFKNENYTLNASTYEEFCDKIQDKNFVNELKTVYINFLNKIKNNYIEKYTKDLENIDNVQQNNVLQETININDLKSQILLQLSQLNSLDIETELKNIDALFVIYKYWPFNTLPPEELGINLPIFNKKDIMIYNSLLNFMETDDAISIMVNPEFFVDKLKDIREKQILNHRDNFVKEIENDIKSTEDKSEIDDLNDIIEMLKNDNSLYKEDLKMLRTAHEILSYWPIMLYPAPSYVLVP